MERNRALWFRAGRYLGRMERKRLQRFHIPTGPMANLHSTAVSGTFDLYASGLWNGNGLFGSMRANIWGAWKGIGRNCSIYLPGRWPTRIPRPSVAHSICTPRFGFTRMAAAVNIGPLRGGQVSKMPGLRTSPTESAGGQVQICPVCEPRPANLCLNYRFSTRRVSKLPVFRTSPRQESWASIKNVRLAQLTPS